MPCQWNGWNLTLILRLSGRSGGPAALVIWEAPLRRGFSFGYTFGRCTALAGVRLVKPRSPIIPAIGASTTGRGRGVVGGGLRAITATTFSRDIAARYQS